MRRWSETAERVAATTKTGEKTAILAAYLAGLATEELPVAAVFLTGRPFPEADQRSLGLGWSGLAGAVLRTAGADDDALRAAYDRSSDISTAVVEVLEAAGMVVRMTEVVPVEVDNQPGGLARALAAIEDAGLGVEYMYDFGAASRGGKAAIVFRFENPDAALAALNAAGIRVLAMEELLAK